MIVLRQCSCDPRKMKGQRKREAGENVLVTTLGKCAFTASPSQLGVRVLAQRHFDTETHLTDLNTENKKERKDDQGTEKVQMGGSICQKEGEKGSRK